MNKSLDKKVLLINPPTPKFVKGENRSIPLSLLYLSSTLQKNNYKVKVMDINNDFLNLERNENLDTDYYFSIKFINELDSFKPDFIGITTLFSGRFKPAISISQRIKKHLPDVPIAMGGIHPTIFPEEILKDYSCVDYICLGEGEKSLLGLINAHFSDKTLLKNMDGVAYKEKGNVLVNKKNSFIENLDDLPFPDFDLINLKDYYFDTTEWNNPKNLPINIPLPIMSSRSCPNQCTFCSMFLINGKKWRPRSAKNVVDEIESSYKKYNHRYFTFVDDNLSLSKKRVLDFTEEIINRGIEIQFDAQLSIKTIDKEVMDNLVESGLVRVCVAPEHGSEFIRNKIMNKNLPTEKIYDFFNLARDYKDLSVKAFFVVGYPQETSETLEDTYQMIQTIAPSLDQVSLFNLVPYPGTEIFEYCKEKGLIKIPLHNLYNIETFSNYNESDDPFIKPHALEVDDLNKFREKVYNFIDRGNT